MMEKFKFLIGAWDMEYNIPKSVFSEKAITATGKGTFKRILDDKYVQFDYSSQMECEKGAAHGIFAWDEKIKAYRFSWFENSGNFDVATCKFINDDTLFMIWYNSVLIQTFTKISENKVVLRMENPRSEGENELFLALVLAAVGFMFIVLLEKLAVKKED